MPRICVILNPVAGKGNGLHMKPRIEENLQKLGLEFKLVLTEYPEHATQLAQEALQEGYEVIVAAGGDGTVNEVINGIMTAGEARKDSTVLAVLPVGRGNDFAFSMNIPTDLDESCALLANDPRMKIDIGRVTSERFPDGLYFGNGVGMGFDAMVGFVAAKMPISGMLSYLIAAIKTMFIYFNAPQVELVLDGQSRVFNALMISIMNGRRMGGSFMMTPHSLPDDGKYDLCLVAEVKRSQMPGLMSLVMKGTQETHPAVTTAQAQKIELRALQGSLPAHADGVTLCEAGESIAVEILPAALSIITR
ncbi:MAG: diacylglycerol kinase family lipid kinase [Anaerolineaceae bacterium]|nr:diacylglycerol kinase family lipid kinase [Anaerolineaceae bacterium]